MTALAHVPDSVRPFVSAELGIVTRVEELLADTDEPALVRVACELADGEETIGAVLGPAHGVGGCGFGRAEACGAAVGEAVERYSACHIPEERLVVASAAELGPVAVAPESFALFAAQQHAEPEFPFHPFRSGSRVPWVDGVDLESGAPALLPAELVFLARPPHAPGGPIGYATSSGLACAATVEDAVERALLELLERDAFMLAWRRRASLGRLDCSGDEGLARLDAQVFSRPGISYRALDLSHVHGVPIVVGVVLGPPGSSAALGVGAAAAPTVAEAWWRALAEGFASRAACRKLQLADPGRTYAEDGSDVRTFDDHIRFYASAERAARAAFLWSSPRVRPTRDVRPLPTSRGRRLAALLERVRLAGSRAYAVDVTAPDVAAAGLHVRRVVAPGLCLLDAPHPWRFLGSPRYLSEMDALTVPPAAVDDLNPDPHPFP